MSITIAIMSSFDSNGTLRCWFERSKCDDIKVSICGLCPLLSTGDLTF